jgi:hypothetical protein
MKELLQRLLKKSRGSPIAKLALATFGVSIGISLAYIWRRRNQKTLIGHEHKDAETLDELIDQIDGNVARKELTDAINRSNIWAKIGEPGVAEDILYTRYAHEYADQLGLMLEIEE